MNENHLQISKTARYYTAGPSNSQHVAWHWLCCHGYAQTAKALLNSMLPAQKADQYLIAPEGLSRFYRNGFYGEVVASWMTSEDRIAEIDDYTAYLDQVLNSERKNIPSPSIGIGFGFSQGTATIIRWGAAKQPDIDTFILYAGLLPDDIHYDLSYWAEKQIIFIYGDEDPFLTEGRIKWQRDFAEKNQLNLIEIPFSGKHEIHSEALQLLDERLRG